tara:strand:+ start:191 stop:595 length:405 start_codon:yes stop_codon:yes gene_type:complete
MNIFLFRIKIEKYSVNNINTLIVFYTTNRFRFKMTSIKPNLISCFKKTSKSKGKGKSKGISWGTNDIRFISPRKIVITIPSGFLTKQELGTIQTGVGIEPTIIEDTRIPCLPITKSRLWKRRHKTKQPISGSTN